MTSNNLTFCSRCGHQKKEELNTHSRWFRNSWYNLETGEPNKTLVCTNKECEAHCDFWGHDYKRITWWNTDVQCNNCKYRPRDF